ncbi:uncharacterized protein LOC128886440 [Hylaeus anthracinus]|uniref:uncharacterized protein LOC128886440 n=1 Tax=Hylaeus anthracinus TaxID=313031 RepID=UPI0023B906D0|nr:uncharacterized protein LOC128886440 [Hylaeus anthracinus]
MFQSPYGMDRAVLQYYGFPITFLSCIGLWPYQSTKVQRFLNPVLSLLLTIFLIAQLTPFATKKFEMIMLLKNMWFIVVTLGSLGKYIAFWQQGKLLKAFMDNVIHDWNSMDEEELKILKKHANIGRRYSTVFACEE